jgi:gas vesicle protein
MNMYENSQGNDMGQRSSSVVMGFAIGALVGAGLALLMAPAPGIETRRRVSDAVRRVRDEVGHNVNKAKSQVSGVKDDLRDAVNQGRESFQRSRSSRLPDETQSPTV